MHPYLLTYLLTYLEVAPGGAHADRHGEALHHLVGGGPDAVQAHDALLGAAQHQLERGLHLVRVRVRVRVRDRVSSLSEVFTLPLAGLSA